MTAISHDLPLASYPTGVFGPFTKATPNGLSGASASIARSTAADPTIWPNAASQIKIVVMRSYDGGVTFPNEPLDWEGSGGIINRKGADVPFSVVSFTCDPQPTHIQVTAQIINGPIKTSVDFAVP